MTARPAGVVVTGTDTGVGKTVVSAWLLVAARRRGAAPAYWKPVQTGCPPDDDAAFVRVAAGLASAQVAPGAVRLRTPASPFEAARLEGVTPRPPTALPDVGPGGFLVVEGAGGLLVPFDATTTSADLFVAWGLPLVVVARPTLGTMNHTLLTLEAARRRGLVVAGVVVAGAPTAAVVDAIRLHGGVDLVVTLPTLADPARDVAALAARADGDPAAAALLGRLLAPPAAAAPDARTLLARDAAVAWHPYTQHGLGRAPLPVVAAEGATLVLDDGRRVLDGLSSWWTSLWGHGHPAIAAAIARQARTLDHVQFGGATHLPAVALAERLVALAPPGLARVFYSDDGSTAVEVALKVALAWHARRGAPDRTRFVALEHAYHGDTVGAMSVSADGPFVADFRGLRFDVTRVPPPVRGADVGACLEALRTTLAREGDRVAAVIVEPLLLGAAGMLVYDAAYLRGAADLARRHGALLVADEVFTGFGRTGARFACGRAGVAPDVLCVSKALTGGALPLAATLVTAEVFDAFRSTRTADAFLHGHSFTANPIACAAALAALDLLDDAALARARAIGDRLGAGLASLSRDPRVRDVRGLGLVRAVEVDAGPGGYLAEAGRRMADAALEAGVFLRPLGDVVYAVPPLCVTDAEVDRIGAAMRAAVAVV
jgi:adenosylmethionine-8-amino-7-oxononanoate aminotransferase